MTLHSTTPAQPALRPTLWLLAALAALFLVVWLSPHQQLLHAPDAMPLWVHCLSETFAIAISFMVFGVAWNAYSPERPSNILILACGFLAVGLLDFAHMLSFPGMPDFVTPADVEKGINFWLAARFAAASAILTVALRPWQSWSNPASRHRVLLLCLGFAALALWLGLFHQALLPRTFIQGKGLTAFKIGAEFLIILLLLVSAVRFYLKARHPQSYDAVSLFAASVTNILSELCFTLYSDATDIFNLLGHAYKIVAYVFIYRAIFVSSVRYPFLRLEQANQERDASQKMLQSVLDNVPVRIFWKDLKLRYLGANDLFLADAGVKQVAELIGKNDFDLYAADHAQSFRADDQRVIDSSTPKLNFEEPIKTADGAERWLLTSKVPLRGLGGEIAGVLGSYTDISLIKSQQEQMRLSEQQLAFLAYHDALTQLPNRLLVQDRFHQAMTAAGRSGNKVALLFLDLDNFKTVNDSLGHSAGDLLIKAVAERLGECLRDSDTVSRQGGDEFLVVLPALPDREAIMPVLLKIMGRLQEPFYSSGHEISTSISVGVAMYPDDGDDFDTLMKKSDMALYRAKDAGRNAYSFFDEDMNEAALENLSMRSGLRRAIERKEFVLHYQPQIDLASGAVIGAEALLRWNRPGRGMVAPGRFIPVAEESGVIVSIGKWVLHEACCQAVAWRKAGLPELVMAVNLSAMQFKPGDLEQTVISVLQESGLDPALLELELTESILIKDTESVLATVKRLKLLGVKLSIDDFGTGYSSLSYLKRFAVDKLKIDQSFIRDLATDPEDAAIVRAIVQMARSLSLRTIAEGVEYQQALDDLRIFRCDEAQGYLFARPLPAAEFERYLSDNRNGSYPIPRRLTTTPGGEAG
jgi:diguanylate cyclase (GGDEF)-like protein/PAS domain S-box-containing protein